MLGILPNTWGPWSILLWPLGLPLSCVTAHGVRKAYHGPAGARHWILRKERFTQLQTGLHRLHLKSPRQLCPDAPVPYGVTLKNKKRELLLFLEPPSLTLCLTLKQPFMVYGTQLHSWPDISQTTSLAPKQWLNFYCLCVCNPRGTLLRKCSLTDL